ncbi:vitelline membrane outer layer protein 1-like [Trichomycterus rosablanca]|uniref:vitelline membrane outer layer protein 1-like n=1 Tax=Trichomycterus rosablanca TaxID=2290929 RepID=UPI002F35CB37
MCRLVYFTFIVFLALLEGHVQGRRTQRSIDRPFASVLTVDNGQRWGTWGLKEMCPAGFYAAGFSLKVAGYWESLLVGDNTALNGIRLHCVNSAQGTSAPYTDYATVQSDTASWGSWTDIKWCKSGMLESFQLRVEPFQGVWDDTAANNIKFKCSGSSEEIKGSGTSWGDWGSWSHTCSGKGICGIQTIVEEPRGLADDTALNDVRFYCCD